MAGKPTILIVDDDPVVAELSEAILEGADLGTTMLCTDSRDVIKILKENDIAVVLLDLYMPHKTGQELLPDIVEVAPTTLPIMLTLENSVDVAVECMRLGAFDYMTKPVDENRLSTSVSQALKFRELQKNVQILSGAEDEVALRNPEAFRGIVTASPRMLRVFHYIENAAPTPYAFLITGESGTGKELIARALHHVSGRRGKFVAVNVAGLDDTMFSDTLFGHIAGAYTGALKARAGLIEEAAEGTLFLDEIGELDLPAQVKLLRLLQEGEYYPLGADQPRLSNARVVAATNADLHEKQQDGSFRKDLYYRLLTHHVSLPPLRERREDIPLLVERILGSLAGAETAPPPKVSAGALKMLSTYRFPGNVRELQALLLDAASRSGTGVIPDDYIAEYIALQTGNREETEEEPGIYYTGAFPTLGQVEEHFIREALSLSEGNQSAAARLLGVSQSKLSRWLSRDPMQNE
ncbi:MAG: sigma-54-dependent transcriptional regulator [Spirochaetota bacterium]